MANLFEEYKKHREGSDTTEPSSTSRLYQEYKNRGNKVTEESTKEVDYASDYLSKAKDSDSLAKYASVMQNADFVEKSRYVGDSGFHLTNQYAHDAYKNLNSGDNKDPRNLSWTPNEKAVFNYLYNTEDYKTATQLLLDLTNDSNARYNEIEKAEAQKRIDNYGNLVGESLLSIPQSVVGGLGQIVGGLSMGLNSALQGEGFSEGWTEAAELNRLSNAANAVREASTNKIAQDSGNQVAPFLYQTGMSVGDSLLSALIAGGVGEVSALLALGGSAAQQKTMEVLNNGGTAQEAAMSGITSGLVEGLTEKISLGHLTKILKGDVVKGGFKELAKRLTKNMLEEAGEEATSELANALTDAIILDWTNNIGTESDLKRFYDEQIASGLSESAATEKTIWELVKNTLVSSAGGALGALMSGGVTTGIRTASDYRAGKTTNEYGRTQDIVELARREGREDIAQMIEKSPSNLNVGYAQDVLAEEAVDVIRDEKATFEDKIKGIERLTELNKKSSPITGIADKNGKMLHPTAIKWEEGSPVFVTEEGTYKAADVKVTDSASKLISLTEDIPEQARQTFIENYNGENLGDYVNKFETAYELGKMDWKDDLTKMVTDGLLTENQMKNIYAAAQKDETSEAYKLELAKKSIEEKKRLIPDKKIRVKIDTSAVDLTKLSENQKHNVTLAEALAKALGFNLTLFDSTKETGKKAHINGSYEASTNTITLDINATNSGTHNRGTTNAIITTLSHEITHWSKTNAPGIYKAFSDAMLKSLADGNGKDITIGEYINANKIHYPGLSDAEIADELVARGCENMLQNSEFAKEALVRMTQEERKTLGQKIIEFFNKIRLAIKEIMGRSDSKSDEYKLLTKDMERLGELQKMWDDLIREAASNAAWANADISDAIKNGVLLNGSEANNFLFSEKTYNEGGRNFLDKWLKKQKDITADERTAILDSMEQIYDTVQKLKEGYQSYSNWAEAGAELRGDNGDISVVVNNGEYALNIDFATVCKKREVLNRVLNELVKSGDLNIYTLTGTDINKINQIIKDNGFEIACALCFVDAKRYRVGEWARSFEETYNDIIYQLAGANGKTADEFNYTNRVLDNPTEALISDAKNVDTSVLDQIIKENTGDSGKLNAKGTLAKAIKENKKLWHKINASEIISSLGLDEIRKRNKDLYTLVNGWEGSAKPKLAHEKIPYQNDILQNGKFKPEAAFKVGGVRIQSFSDFVPTMIFDYVQMVSELQAKGLPAHAYTKELTFAKLFGKTGIKINLSAIPKGKKIKSEWLKANGDVKKEYADLYARAKAYVGLKTNEEGYPVDVNGEVITTNLKMTDAELERAVYETDDESIDLDEAVKLENTPGYDKNVGIIFVAASDNHLRKMLNDPNIPMVIPYHKSGINPVVAHLRNIASYSDYTTTQNTMYGDGKKIDRKDLKGQDKEYYDSLDWYRLLEKNKYDAKKAAAEYVKLCEKKGWKPKFDKFKEKPNYYKLIEDFRMYDSKGKVARQEAVKLTSGLGKNGKAILNMPTNAEFIKILEGDEKTPGLKKYDESVSALENVKLYEMLGQVKTELQKVQNSVKEDSEGKPLTADQIKFFKNSVVKDAEGRLIRVYHGTKNGGFTVFNKADDGISYFFTDNKEVAETYSGISALQNPDTPMSFEELEGAFEFFDNEIQKTDKGYLITDSEGKEHNVKSLKEAQAWLVDNNMSMASAQGIGEATNYEVYLNIQNPLVVDAQGRNWDIVNFEPEDNELTKKMKPVYSRLLELWEKEREGSLTRAEIKELDEAEEKYSELENESNRKFKVYESTRDIAKYAYENGYDGVIFNNIVDNGGYSLSDAPSTVYVAFNSNQIKSIYNEHPTENWDIRYSQKEDREYMDAVESGNMTLAQEMVNKAAAKRGYTYKGYHGTDAFGFTKFEKSDDGLSFFFASNPNVASSYVSSDKGGVYDAWIKLENPLVVESNGMDWNGIILGKLAKDFNDWWWSKHTFRPSSQEFYYTNTRRISQFAKSKGYDGVIFKELYDIGGKNADSKREKSDIFVVFDSSQVKSADPVTYDNNGNVIPLSERFSGSPDIRYSQKEDSEYMDAVNDNDLNKAQYMVDKAAADWGAIMVSNGRKPLKLFHGTPRFGFTEFDLERNTNSRGMIYTTSDSAVSANYAGRDNYARQRSIGRKYIENATSIKDIIRNAETVYGTKYHVMTDAEKRESLDKIHKQVVDMSEKINELYEEAKTLPFYNDDSDEALSMSNKLAWVEDLFFTIGQYTDVDDVFKYNSAEEYYKVVAESLEKYKENYEAVREYFTEHRGEIINNGGKELYKLITGYDLSDLAIDVEFNYLKPLNPGKTILVNEVGNVNYADEIQKATDATHSIGSYVLYGNLGERPYIVDAQRRMWTNVVADIVDDDNYGHSTDKIANRAKELGYTSVVIKNVSDGGQVADDYIFFNTDQVKSADAVTYDDNGEVIPLSERFGEKRDIRYSEKDNENYAIFEGKPICCGSASLTDGKIEEVHTYEEAEAADFHHSLYFTENQVDKIDNDENVFFWVTENGEIEAWRDEIPDKIIRAIRKQLTIVNDNDKVFSYKDDDGYLHLESDDILSLDDFENYLNKVIGRSKRIEAHLRRLNVEIKDNVVLNNTKLYQFAKVIKEQYNVNETIKSIAEELSKAYLKVTDIETFDKAAESVAKKYAKTEEDIKALISDIREASWRISDNLTMAEKYNEAMKELRERLKNAKEEVREDAQRKRLIQKIVEREDKLITMLRKNDKENHIPDVLKAPLKTLLELVNVESYVTTEAMANNFNALANALQNVSADHADPATVDEALKDLTMYFDSNGYFVQNVKDIAAEAQEKVGKAMNVKHGASVLDLSLDSLKKLNEALVAISHAAWNYDKVLAEDTTQRISTRSEATMRFVGQFENRKAMSDVLKKAISFFAWDNTTPIYGYDRFGEGGRETFRGIMKGDDQLTLNSKTIIDFTKSVFTGQEAEDWSKEYHPLGIGNYKITTAQIMSLYCLNKRQAAKQHLYAAKDLYGKHLEGAVQNVYGEVIDGQGIVIGATKGNEKTVPIKVTKSDVERITSMLTDRQKEVADKLQEFMGTVCADWGNYVTMRRFGIMQFGEDNYFPMQVFRENAPSLPQEIPQQASIFKLLNMGFTKSLNERGNGALELNSIFDVFIKHSSEMAAYNAFALPILDVYKWLSYKEDGPDGIRSLKTVSRLAYGDDGIKFIMNHLEDLNGTSNSTTSAEQIVKGLIRRYKTAATAANMRVVLMQPTSYLRAVNEIDAKYLKRAITLNPKALKETISEMNEKSPLAMKKNGLGAFDVNISRTVAEQALQTEDVKSAKGYFEKAMNISMIAASKADEITWATLYKAVQLETKERYPEATGDVFDSIVNDRFRDICYRTQVFDSINARSNLMRKKDLFHQILTAFGSEPTLSYSMLSNNVFLYAVDARNGAQRAWNKWGKKIKHAFVAYMMSAIAVSAVAAAPDWLRDDEDDKSFIETYFKNFGMNILGEATGLLPYFRDIYSVVVEGYDPSRPDEEILKTARQAWSAMVKAIESGEITYRTVYQAAKLFSQSTGLPVGNVVRDMKSLWNKTVGEVFGMKIK